MRITVSYKNIKKALSVVERIVSKSISLPILGNILIKTENGRLKISATNLEVGINCFIGAKIENPGEIAVPVRIFSDFINNISEEKIDLLVKNNTLTIFHNKQKTQILAVDPKDFPIIPKIKNPDNFNIPSKILRQGLMTVFDSIATSETRPEISGVFFQVKNNSIHLAATDSFRLAEKIVNIKSKENLEVILPRTTSAELIRVFGDTDGDVAIRTGDGQIAFLSEDVEIISRTIDGTYPDYKKVIPDKWLSKALVQRDDFEKKVRLAGLFSSNIADIKLVCGDKNLAISAKNPEKGETNVSLDVVLKNDPFEASLNYHYLLDGIKAVNSKNIIIEYSGSGSPIVLKPEGETKDTTYLIMPLRN